MLPESIVSGARTVVGIASHFERLKLAATPLLDSRSASDRGYFTPTEDEEVRHLLVSYWQSRNALIELVVMLHRSTASYDESESDVRHLPTHDRVVAFLPPPEPAAERYERRRTGEGSGAVALVIAGYLSPWTAWTAPHVPPRTILVRFPPNR